MSRFTQLMFGHGAVRVDPDGPHHRPRCVGGFRPYVGLPVISIGTQSTS